MANNPAVHSACPECSGELGEDQGFTRWCPSCEWNLDPAPAKVRKRLGRWVDERSDRAARQLFDEVRAGRPGRRYAFVITLLSLLVHLTTVALVVGAVVLLIVPSGDQFLRVVGAVILVGIAVVVQPLHRRRPLPGVRVGRDAAPVLFGLVDEVAGAIGGPPVDEVRVDARFNAFHTRTRKAGRVLGIGLSLWTVLDAEARVAVIGHELAHAINGDLRQRRMVGWALSTLHRWAYLLRPDRPNPWLRMARRRVDGLTQFIEAWVVPLILLPFSLLIGGFGRLLGLLADRQGQRCEYLADQLGSTSAGSSATRRSLEATLMADFCERTVARSIRFSPTADPWPTLRAAALSIPEAEWERRRRLARRQLNRIDGSHPPTQLRSDLIADRPDQPALVTLGADRAARIEEELAPIRLAVAESLRVRFGVAGITVRPLGPKPLRA